MSGFVYIVGGYMVHDLCAKIRVTGFEWFE